MNVDIKNLEYRSLSEVICEVRDMFIIDIGQHCLILPPAYQKILMPEPTGVYIPHRLEPIISFETGAAYYTANTYRAGGRPDVYDFETFIRSKSPIVASNGRQICSAPAMSPASFCKHCQLNYSAVHVAFILIFEMFQRLHAYSFTGTNLPTSMLRIERYVRPEYLQDVSDERISHPGHATIAAEAYRFIGRDRFNNYRLRFDNATLFLEKGNDFRVVEYYRRIFDELDSKYLEY